MINYKYDFELYTLNELPTNDARLFLNIIVSNALTKAQAVAACFRNESGSLSSVRTGSN